MKQAQVKTEKEGEEAARQQSASQKRQEVKATKGFDVANRIGPVETEMQIFIQQGNFQSLGTPAAKPLRVRPVQRKPQGTGEPLPQDKTPAIGQGGDRDEKDSKGNAFPTG